MHEWLDNEAEGSCWQSKCLRRGMITDFHINYGSIAILTGSNHNSMIPCSMRAKSIIAFLCIYRLPFRVS